MGYRYSDDGIIVVRLSIEIYAESLLFLQLNLIMSSLQLTNIGQLVSYNSKISGMETLEKIQIAIDDGIITEIGNKVNDADRHIDCKGKLITPGFVDSHTHPVFLNGREDEFAMRLKGTTYKEIATKGGGIINSVNDVRNASQRELFDRVFSRMNRFLSVGTTTIECKSGYGLNTESEIKSLKVIDEVNNSHKIDMVATFMGAHAIPVEFIDDPDEYVKLICDEMLPAVARQGIAKFNDVFCENGYFNIEQARMILSEGANKGLVPRLHAEEFENSGSAELAAELGAVSADHLMNVNDVGIEAISAAGVIATLLPGTTFFLGSSNYAPYKRLENAGVNIALATDYNPGSCYIHSMPFIIALACIFMKMDVMSALKAATFMSAKSLQLEDKIGSIEVGKQADMVIWDLERIVQIPYNVSNHPIRNVIKSGELIF
tara:strand:- start:788 stop:2086 length:1299 start_codon:yes stop_codon:yes gene_type:complete